MVDKKIFSFFFWEGGGGGGQETQYYVVTWMHSVPHIFQHLKKSILLYILQNLGMGLAPPPPPPPTRSATDIIDL